MLKRLKKKRRAARKRRRRAEDAALLATASIHQRDEENARENQAPCSETLHHPRRCYVCKREFRRVHHFYHAMCPRCAEENYTRREARCDLTGRRALITGGRVKIGRAVALKMLRDGAHVTVTTRFPSDAARRYAVEGDFDAWRERLVIHGVDLRDVRATQRLIEEVRARGPLSILINNAAQTIRRPPAYYRELGEGERRALPGEWSSLLAPAGEEAAALEHAERDVLALFHALAREARDPNGHFPAGEVDEEGQPLDLRETNSWRLLLDEVAPIEVLEAWLVTTFSPYLLNAGLKPAMEASPFEDRYIVNVSAVEGQFAYGNKTAHHPHTNMAKAAMNMMTRTSAQDYARSGIYMTSVDTGWITNENAAAQRERARQRGWRPPLDVIDGAARVYDPIARGVTQGERLRGVFLKNYDVCPW